MATPAGRNADVVPDEDGREDLVAGLDEIVREGARRMLAEAVEAEAAAYIAALADQVDEAGRRGAPQRARPAAGGDHGSGGGAGADAPGR